MVAGHVRFSDGVIGKKQLVETPPEKFQWVTCASVSDTTVCRTPFFLFKRHKQTEGKKKDRTLATVEREVLGRE